MLIYKFCQYCPLFCNPGKFVEWYWSRGHHDSLSPEGKVQRAHVGLKQVFHMGPITGLIWDMFREVFRIVTCLSNTYVGFQHVPVLNM